MRVTLLSARTLRATAYASALRHVVGHELSIVEYGGRMLPRRRFPPQDSLTWMPLPEWLRVDWCHEYRLLRESCATVDVDGELNSAETLDRLAETAPEMVVFAGASGQLVGADLLRIAPVLHLHPGQLPEFRGSTTIYWSLLCGEPVSVTAIYLSEEIDQGRVVAHGDVASPTPESDIDGLYDAGIRAMMLRTVMSSNAIPPPSKAQPCGGADFYVVHPVLKNVAIAMLGRGSEPPKPRQT